MMPGNPMTAAPLLFLVKARANPPPASGTLGVIFDQPSLVKAPANCSLTVAAPAEVLKAWALLPGYWASYWARAALRVSGTLVVVAPLTTKKLLVPDGLAAWVLGWPLAGALEAGTAV